MVVQSGENEGDDAGSLGEEESLRGEVEYRAGEWMLRWLVWLMWFWGHLDAGTCQIVECMLNIKDEEDGMV